MTCLLELGRTLLGVGMERRELPDVRGVDTGRRRVGEGVTSFGAMATHRRDGAAQRR